MATQTPTANSLKPGKWVNSTCKMCLHSCSNRIHVTYGGIINKVEGNPTNPSNNGKLCPKGNSVIMRHYDPKRFKGPMKRSNPEKGPGVDPMWVPISWEEALDTSAKAIKQAMDEDPRKILPSIEDFQKMNTWIWPLAFGNRNFYQSGGTMCGGAYHPLNGYIHSTFGATNDPKYCNYWINNGAGDGFSSHLHAAAAGNWVAKARRDRNMKVVTIEPRMSISAAKSEEWVPIRPATDRQFAMGMSHVFIKEKLCDYVFLRKDTNAPYLVGEDELFVRNSEGQVYVWDSVADCAKAWNDPTITSENMALEGNYVVDGKECRPAFQCYKDILDECTPQWTEDITTVSAATVQRIAREFAQHAQVGATIEIEDGRILPLRPAAYNYYRGAQGHKLGMQTNQAFQMVNMLMGNIDHPGGRIGVTIDDQCIDNNHCTMGDSGQMLGTPHQLGSMPEPSYPPNEYHLAGFFPCGVNAPHLNMMVHLDKEKWGVEYTPDVIVNCHSNPVWSIQGPREKWIEFLQGMRFIVCIDIVPNEMTDFADIIMPSNGVLESWNSTMIEPPYTEGPCFRQPVVDKPLHDTISEEDIFNELSERVGILDQYNEIINGALGFHQKPELMLKPGVKYGDRDIAEKKGLLWNDKPIEYYMEHGHASTERRLDKWYRPWEGMRLNFYIEDLITERNKLKKTMTDLKVPYVNEWPFDDYSGLPTARPDPIHLEPKEFNMYAITFKDIQLNFGESLSNPWIKDIVYRDPVHTGLLINPKTAAAQGLADGDVVRIESPYGKLFGRLKTSEGVHHETLCISNSLSRTKTENRFAAMAGGHYNDLLSFDMSQTDGASGQPETSVKVKIIKLDDWPDFLKEGGSVYDLVDRINNAKGKGGQH